MSVTRQSFGIKKRMAIYVRQNGLCAICNLPMKHGMFDVDHIQALVHGGDNDDSNLRALHHKCHAEKSARDVRERSRGDRIAAGGKTRRGPPMPGSRNSPWKRLMTGETVRR